MLVFWWQGRGYQTIWIWLLTMFAFGAAVAVGKPYIPDRPWYWGAAFCAAAIANWKRGSALNAASLAKLRPATLMQRLFYKARHRFMSMRPSLGSNEPSSASGKRPTVIAPATETFENRRAEMARQQPAFASCSRTVAAQTCGA